MGIIGNAEIGPNGEGRLMFEGLRTEADEYRRLLDMMPAHLREVEANRYTNMIDDYCLALHVVSLKLDEITKRAGCP